MSISVDLPTTIEVSDLDRSALVSQIQKSPLKRERQEVEGDVVKARKHMAFYDDGWRVVD
jgi:hypothetical protein